VIIVETSKDLFRELEKAEQLFSNGSIRNGQKVLREVLKASKSLNKVSNKLRHKINYVLNESKYFDEMSSFATNPKRDNLIDEINKLVSSPIKEPKKHAHAIHNLQRQWQLLDISGKSASKNQWNKFNDLSNKAWESCKDYFEEIKQIKIKNAENRKNIIFKINSYVEEHQKKWPTIILLSKFLRTTYDDWQKFAPVLDSDLDMLKEQFFNSRQPIINEIKTQEVQNKKLKEELIKKVDEIDNENNDAAIQQFKKIKNEWSNIGPVGKKYEQKLWNKFNACADKLFIEKNKKIEEEKLKLKNLNDELLKGGIDINTVIKELPTFMLSKRSEEYKTLSKSIRKAKEDQFIKIKEKKIDMDKAPNIFTKEINQSFQNKKTDKNMLLYQCIKLEVLAGIDSLKKDQKIKNQVQLELLSNKFNKSSELKINDVDSVLKTFIENYSMHDPNNDIDKLWKRIIKCFDKLI
jgi:hypothetical protein